MERYGALLDGFAGGEEAARLRSHLETCAFCKTEFQMMQEFTAAEPEVAEQRDLSSIVIALRHTRGRLPASTADSRPRSWFSLPIWPRLAAPIGVVAVLVAVGLQVRSRMGDGPEVLQDGQGSITRSAAMVQISPSGDVAAVPDSFQWDSVAGAVTYQFRVTEVDGTPVFEATVVGSRVPTPTVVRSAMLPRKTLLLSVTAQGVQGKRLAGSEPARIRVVPE